MRPGGGKQKGGSFERKVCVALSRWLTKGKRTDCFWRSAMSGGRATVRGRKGEKLEAQRGDISGISPEGVEFMHHVVIECKHVKNLKLPLAVTHGRGPLPKFWKKLCKETKEGKKAPILVAKQNNLPVLLIMTHSLAAWFSMDQYMCANLCRMPGPYGDVCVFLWSDFLAHAIWVEGAVLADGP